MPRSIMIRDVKIEKKGLVGLRIHSTGRSICIDPGQDIDRCDLILCTHDHSRHCEKDPVVSSGKKIIAPFTENIKPYIEIKASDLRIVPVPAYNRVEVLASTYMNKTHPKNCCYGFIVNTPESLSVYYTGDTNLIDEIRDLDIKVDILVPCIGRYTTMTPEEALELAKSIRPWMIILTHYSDIEQAIKYRDLAHPYTNIVIMR